MKKMPSFGTIEKWLRDADCDVRQAAMNACQGREGIVSRSFSPPKEVYKKCIGGVIVCAAIPADAHIRGLPGRKCRASKAVIKKVIGDVCGEPVGISKYDAKTLYYEGDVVDILDFDFSHEECSTGFHFFCTCEEAENYN